MQVKRMGKSVVLLNFNNHLGGLSSSGLGQTDIGSFGNDYIQGLSREFYTRVGAKYGASGARFTFEPKRAEQVFDEMAADAGVPVHHFSRIESVVMNGQRIVSVTMDNGNVFRATMFIDASYEGDLLKKAGVSYTVGREANATYGETINGIQRNTSGHQFDRAVSAYVVPNDPSSGLLPGVNPNPSGANGTADGLIQAYCFRMCLTNVPANRVMITKPEGYNEAEYEILFRWIESNPATFTRTRFFKWDGMPNGKTDSNNDGAVSCDYIGGNNNYVEADYATREQVVREHERWQRGLVWTIQNHPRVPENIRTANAAWGLPLDEFPDNNHWPYQLYIREARRMISDYVMTEKHCTAVEVAPDSIGLAAYTMDSHNTQRYVNASGHVRNEGDVQINVKGPYPISYRAIVPKVGECENLLVPWCLSASHVSFGSFRMEPVFMMTGQSAATAACFAIDDGVSVQQVSYPKLRAQLLADKMKLTVASTEPVGGIIVDNADATGVTTTGEWLASSASTGAHNGSYLHDNNTGKGTKSVRYTPTLPEPGKYEIFLRWAENGNRATNVPVDINLPAGTTTVSVNQKTNGGAWNSLGEHTFNQGFSETAGSVTIRTSGTLIDVNNGYVIADAVRFVHRDGTVPEPDVRVSLWGANTTTAEPYGPGAPVGQIVLSRTQSTTQPLTVQLAVSGDATPGSDYTALPATATFPAGAATVSLPISPLADTLAEGTESVGVALAPGAGYLADTTVQSASVAIHDRPFDDWRHSKFNAAHLNDPSISGDLADPDGDGLNNLLEFVSGSEPQAGDPTPPGTRGSIVIGAAGYQTLTFRRRISPDISCVAEVSPDLVDWRSDPGAVELTTMEDDGRMRTIQARDLTPETAAGKRFIRLRVVRAQN
ncbi:FAD-dependent oxidoreductase [Luteolibacter sp. SL250]|uniref:FAD-dependent oxidoreductase n=1 Tax=Luteolibacter sp. SL250 TaxID=2995170 RepID=UPI0031F31500